MYNNTIKFTIIIEIMFKIVYDMIISKIMRYKIKFNNNMLLYIANQLQTLGSNDTNLVVIYILAIIIAVSVIIVKSPVVSIIYLIGLFITIAVYLVKSGMTFAGLIYLLVYVGAISILFIFIVMLLNVRISELLTEGKNSTILAIMSVISIYYLFSKIIPGSEGPYSLIQLTTAIENSNLSISNISELSNILSASPTEPSPNTLQTSALNITQVINEYANTQLDVASVTAKSWDVSLAETTHISSIGNIFYTILVINLIVISFIILVAMIGAIVITVKSINKLPESDINTNISTSIDLNN